jgi:hypothetical protein
MARQRRSIGTFGPGVPLERAYRVAPDEDLGGWFESDGEMTVYVIDVEIELTLEKRGLLAARGRRRDQPSSRHPAPLGRRRRRGGPDPRSVAHAHPAAGPVPLPAPDGQAGYSIH